MVRRALLVVAVLAAVLAAAPAAALAHATLEGTSPPRGAVVAHQPRQVVFRFDEAVEGSLGAVRVFGAGGGRVDDSHVVHPGGAGAQLAVGLRSGLADGTYTATYRVVSADGHIVTGGTTFSVGRAGAAPSQTIDQLIAGSRTGAVTDAAAGIARGVTYLATAFVVGILAFLLLCWRPALAASAGGGEEWRLAAGALGVRARLLLVLAIAAGIVAGAAGIVLEGAAAAGTTFWGALDSTTVHDVLRTRFGTVWGIRVVVFAGLAATLLVAPARRMTSLEPVALGADGLALARPRALQTAVLALGAAALIVAPALEGHSATLPPATLLTIDDAFHVVAMCAWLGGLVAFVTLVPRATRALQAPDRARLLSALLRRFSPIALAAVVVLAITGTLQAIPYLTALDQLWTTGYGRELLAKIVLLLTLAGLGALNRRRTLPALARIAQAGGTAGAAGHLLRRTLRAEVALLVAVLGVTSALVDGVPPVAAASGPFNGEAHLGNGIDLDLTVDPARPGANEIHLYLLRAHGGAPYTGTKELTVTARQRDKAIGPLPVPVHLAGPGHYTADTVQLVPGGTWTLTVTDRYSAFDEVSTQVDVPLR